MKYAAILKELTGSELISIAVVVVLPLMMIYTLLF
ncbi:hypothetical protein Thivi_4546 [Thiocystis violascens DSM 198]|uniref:Uncharacterized protein n=1 Tax=Thiocystis violascens (strain ATCC 17096 / DSM 198 / 6111) TaxID=765911 RepID=I3YH72_THIV6|nr:hypothetical protein Thivi_4546 [Thiocystis violascens DSM 198]